MPWVKNIFRNQFVTTWVNLNPGSITCLIILVWTFMGLTGHDPWKPDEAHTFGAFYSTAKSGNWIKPMLADEAYLKNGPLVYISASLASSIFNDILPLHDGARLATGFWMLLVFIFISLSARELWGGKTTWLAPLILAGSAGLLLRGHQLTSNVIFLAGVTICIYGLAVVPRRPVNGGIAIGSGLIISTYATSLVEPFMILSVIPLMMIISPLYRTKRTCVWLGTSISVSLLFIIIWPLLLFHTDPNLFLEWFYTHNLEKLKNIFIFRQDENLSYYINILPWYAWPSWPLALWTLWIARGHGFEKREIQLPVVAFATYLTFISLLGEGREVYALPLLIPLSLLASQSLESTPRGANHAFYWFSIMIASVFIILCWLAFFVVGYEYPLFIAKNIEHYVTSKWPEPQIIQLITGALASIIWILFLFNLKKSNERSILAWTSGVTISWSLTVFLLFPWIDNIKTYRFMVEDLVGKFPKTYNCIIRKNIGEPQRAMLDYFGSLVTTNPNNIDQSKCELLLKQTHDTKNHEFNTKKWKLIWQGSRNGDKNERFYLFHKEPLTEK